MRHKIFIVSDRGEVVLYLLIEFGIIRNYSKPEMSLELLELRLEHQKIKIFEKKLNIFHFGHKPY